MLTIDIEKHEKEMTVLDLERRTGHDCSGEIMNELRGIGVEPIDHQRAYYDIYQLVYKITHYEDSIELSYKIDGECSVIYDHILANLMATDHEEFHELLNSPELNEKVKSWYKEKISPHLVNL